ncbi:hypothetical protein ACFSSA_01440 [Luteolibacter algae]|uniref:Uncharacterized protein n=1 Tax=Luteolibacter algae TaxID=454151 RepID=A0ABW5D3R9_9BACT
MSAKYISIPCFLVAALIGLARGNEAPHIFIHPADMDISGNARLWVSPSIDDDGLPAAGGSLVAWELVGGPASGCFISAPAAADSFFTFTEPGDYTLRLNVSDGELGSSKKLFVKVDSNGITDLGFLEVSDEAYQAARDKWNSVRNQYFTGVFDPAVKGFDENAFHLTEDSEVIVTLLFDGAGKNSSLAWYDNALSELPPGGQVIWSHVATGADGPLEQGSRMSLGLLKAGTDLRFLISSSNGENVICQDAARNPLGKVLVASRFSQSDEKSIVLAFEDEPAGDGSFDDVVIQIDIIPHAKEVTQHDDVIAGQAGLMSDLGSRGVKARLIAEMMDLPEYEITGGVFQMPSEDISYRIDFLDDRSPMKFSLGVVELDTVSDLGASSLLFRECAVKYGHILMDDRTLDPGGFVNFRPADFELLGKRVVFFVIPNNIKDVFLSNAWRYTPKGSGDNTKRQPLFSAADANPGAKDQFLLFGNTGKTVLLIEDRARGGSAVEAGELSDSSFDDVQLRFTPSLKMGERYGAFYGSALGRTMGLFPGNGLVPDSSSFDVEKVLDAARGTSRWNVLFTTLSRPDGQFLRNEYGESLPVSENGALSVNKDWEAGIEDQFFIEQQRYGADVIETGIILDDEELIAEGIKMIEWGFARQASDGSFPGTGDAVHSASLFLEAASRAGLALRRHQPQMYRNTIREWRRKCQLCAHWFVIADDAGSSSNLLPFGHRYFLRAAALQQTAWFSRDLTLEALADEYIVAGLAAQQADGCFVERNEFDPSYQMVGMAFASRYLATSRNENLRTQLSQAMWIGVSRFLADVSPTGMIYISPTSRTASELSRSGNPKRFDYKHCLRTLVMAEDVLQMPGAENAALLILEKSME